MMCLLTACVSTGTDSDVPGETDITDLELSNRDANCETYVGSYRSSIRDVARNYQFSGSFSITKNDTQCLFSSNGLPNHHFNDGSSVFPNEVSEQSHLFTVSKNPEIASTTTALSLRSDDAVMLNGVILDLLAAACYGISDGRTGCGDDVQNPWRYDPMHADNNFATDTHNAHSQPDGTYHYHGDPKALYDQDGGAASPVIGFAADGFPIFGPYINDNGSIRKSVSSYRLKSGNRQAIGTNPGGAYDGTFIQDYEYVSGLGDLDECNGMTLNGQYGYYITEVYPWVLGCFKGTPDASFNK